MSAQPSLARVHALALDATPGLTGYARAWAASSAALLPAAPRLLRAASAGSPPAVTPATVTPPASALAWSDAQAAAHLRERHQALGASAASLRALELLARGSAHCVVTGQQPGLLGGPLYTAYKIAGAIALARRLAQERAEPVVPVYWCGSDDSDFEEIRGAWLLDPARGPLRAELPASLHAPGMQIGGLPGDAVAAVEEAALAQLTGRGDRAALHEAWRAASCGRDLGERCAALYLSLFGAEGLVVVDARMPRLLELGRPLFRRYAERIDHHAAAVDARGAALMAAGFDVPLSAAATRSALFRVRAHLREKLAPEDVTAALRAAETVAPSVMLRPLWQDLLLAPLAAVLGPSELTYHAQIAPLYAALSVAAAAPELRPHVTLLPPGVAFPAGPAERAELLAGGEPARERLARAAQPPAWRAAEDRARARLDALLAEYVAALGSAAQSKPLMRALDRMRRELDALARVATAAALDQGASQAPLGRWSAEWLAVRGVRQERAYAAAMGWALWGRGFGALLDELEVAYVEQLEADGAVGFAVATSVDG